MEHTLRVFNNARDLALHDGDGRIGCAQINTDDGALDLLLLIARECGAEGTGVDGCAAGSRGHARRELVMRSVVRCRRGRRRLHVQSVIISRTALCVCGWRCWRRWKQQVKGCGMGAMGMEGGLYEGDEELGRKKFSDGARRFYLALHARDRFRGPSAPAAAATMRRPTSVRASP